MSRQRRRKRDDHEILSDPRLPAAISAALKHGDSRSTAFRAASWAMFDKGGDSGARAAESVISRASVTVGGLPVAEGVEVRATLTRWAGREVAHLRTWFRDVGSGKSDR